MLTNYFKIAFRNIAKNPIYSMLNIGGLSMGLAVVMLIGLYLRDELTYDAYHENADRVHRINLDVRFGGEEQAVAVVSAPMGPTLVRDYPAVEAQCRFRQWGFITVKKGNEAIEEGNNTYVDSTFFEVFSLPLIEGDPKTALTEPGTGVISEKIALKYFGTSTGIVGRTFRINENRDMRITGVMQNMPSQSHLHYDFLFSMSSIRYEADANIWLNNNFQTYVLLRPDASAKDLEKQFPEIVEKYVGPEFEQATGGTMADLRNNGDWMKYSLQNVRDIHLHSDRNGEHEANSDVKYVWIFGIVALFVLLLACVNFMNLSTARSAGRAREVGVRKALGSGRAALVRQFLAESLLLTFISFGIALVGVGLLLPAFREFSDKDIQFTLLDMPMLASLAGLAAVTAIVAGSYPAFFLSAFQPIEVLKGKLVQNSRSSASWFRGGLVVFQFFISVALIASVLVVKKQLDFIQSKKLGYDKAHLVMLRNTWWLREKTLDFKAQLEQIQGIEAVSCADFFPTPSSRNNTVLNEVGADAATNSVSSQFWEVDADYLKTFGLTLMEGRWFREQFTGDSICCVMNQAAAKKFGWPSPIGKKLSTYTDPGSQASAQYEVIGVIEDFNFESLRENIGPVIMTIGQSSGTMALRLSPNADIKKTLAAVGTRFKEYLPAQPYNYRFVDEEFNQQYRKEGRIGGILGAFAGFAIFIACLGLFGLAAFTAEQRTKEIGIRKVLGASVGNITGLLSRDFLKLVLLATILAAPLAYFFMQKWLEDFAYRIDLAWWMFVLAGLAAIFIAFVTVSFQSVKAALANPVKSLRSD